MPWRASLWLALPGGRDWLLGLSGTRVFSYMVAVAPGSAEVERVNNVNFGQSVLERVLGAGEWRTLWKVTIPLSLPGVVAGCILTYTACITAFVTQTLIGGARLIYMPLHIFQQAIGANNWPFAAAISVIFMVAVLVIVGVLVDIAIFRVHILGRDVTRQSFRAWLGRWMS